MWVRGVTDRGYDPGMPPDDEVHPQLGLGNMIRRDALGPIGDRPDAWSLRLSSCRRAAGRLSSSRTFTSTWP